MRVPMPHETEAPFARGKPLWERNYCPLLVVIEWICPVLRLECSILELDRCREVLLKHPEGEERIIYFIRNISTYQWRTTKEKVRRDVSFSTGRR